MQNPKNITNSIIDCVFGKCFCVFVLLVNVFSISVGPIFNKNDSIQEVLMAVNE